MTLIAASWRFGELVFGPPRRLRLRSGRRLIGLLPGAARPPARFRFRLRQDFRGAVLGEGNRLVQRRGVDAGLGVHRGLRLRGLRLRGLRFGRRAPPLANAFAARCAPVELAQGAPRGLLLGCLLGRSMSGPERIGAGVDDRRVLALPAAAGTGAVVVGGQAEPLLHHLLQAAFEVLVQDGLGQRAEAVQVVVVRRVVAGVQEDRAQHSLEGIGQQRLEAAASAFGDPLAEEQVVTQTQLLRESRQRVRVDHGGPQLRHLAFLGSRSELEEVLSCDELQNRVAEILEALVVSRRDLRTLVGERAVGQRLPQQRRVAKSDSDLLFQLLQAPGGDLRIHDGTTAATARTGFAYVADFSCMYSQAWPTVVMFSASSSGISSPVFSSNA